MFERYPLEVPARLGVGPMSANCVDAVIDLAVRERQRVMLIPSRRQVEMDSLGGGYVEGWTSADFAAYVRARDPEGFVLLCRDHGGPWQAPSEQGMSEGEAMRSSVESFKEDLSCGFDLLHIDTCLEGDHIARPQDAIDRLVALYAESHAHARTLRRDVLFEVGFEVQSTDTNDPREFAVQIQEVCRRLHAAGLPRPTFIVAQTGTKVLETENCGALTLAPAAVGHSIRDLARVCHDAGSALKSHNCDYLSDAALRDLVSNGVSAINVAPEFGVVETRAFLAMMTREGLIRHRDEFLSLAYESGKWKKWMKPNTAATDEDRAVIAGHYVFATPEFREIKKQVEYELGANGPDVDTVLRDAVGRAIRHYLNFFHSPVYASRI